MVWGARKLRGMSAFCGKKGEALQTVACKASLIVGVPRFELGTPCSQSRCANRTALHPENTFVFQKRCKDSVIFLFRQIFCPLFYYVESSGKCKISADTSHKVYKRTIK